jgi:phosphopantothenoylcysteine synthetase/decarboxylase
MNILITAGNTHAPIDRARVLTNVFTGRTGAHLARTAWARGHQITVLTSQPYTLSDLPDPATDSDRRATVVAFQTFDDLAGRFQHEVKTGRYDCLIHAATVSDYLSAGVYAPAAGTFFNARTRQWEGHGGPPGMDERKTGQIGSTEPELWLRLVKAPKLVDRVRGPWGFAGLLVVFRLEVGVADDDLLAAAEQARVRSAADLVVTHTLDGPGVFAYLGPVDGRYERVDRRELAERLILTVERLQRGRAQQHG